MIKPNDIIAARRRITGLVAQTPLEHSLPLSALCGAEVLLKLECAQTTGSFKLRGAANALLADPSRSPVLTCSAGNHGLGIAHAAAATGIAATIVVPTSASPAKIAALRRYPIALRLHGQTYAEAETEALRLAQEGNCRFISPYNHPAVIAGQGTLALELLEQVPAIEVLLVPVGGGGLISGMALWAKAINPQIRIIGIQPAASAAMMAALQAGAVVVAPDAPTLADGLAGNIEPNTITFNYVRDLVDSLVAVSEAAIAAAMRWLINEHHLIVEGSGAVGVAALLANDIPDIAGKRIAVPLTGRNVVTERVFGLVTPNAFHQASS